MHTENELFLLEMVEKAVAGFNENETVLIENNASERCICARLMLHMQYVLKDTVYSDYYADVEYDRGYNGNNILPKQLYGKKIYADLIVHKRIMNDYQEFDNLICIEMKKKTSGSSYNDDIKRLEAMTDKNGTFQYKLGLMIIIDKRQKIIRIDKVFPN